MRKCAVMIVSAILGIAGIANAAPILALDFGITGSTATEPGFQPFLVSTPGITSQLTQTFDGITVQFFGTPGGRDRGGIFEIAPFTYGDLLRDLLTSLNETNTGTTLQISGLQANTPYDLRVWSHDKSFNDNAVYSWYDTTSTPVLVGTITNDTTSPSYPDNNAFSLAFTATADATGAIKLGHTDPVGNGTINALTISAVPEPGTLMLLVGAVAGLTARRRR